MPSTRTTIIAACVLLLGHAMAIARLGGHPSGAVLSDSIQLVLGGLCVLTSLQAFRRSGSGARYYWRWLIVTFSVWMVAQALGIYIDITSSHSIDVIDDLLFYCSQAPLGMLIFLDPDHEPNRFDRLHVLDFLQVCVFVASVYLYFSRGPGSLTNVALLGPFGWTRSLAFDIVLITGFWLRAFLADSPLVRARFGRLGLFLLCSALADSYADFSPNQLQPGGWFDLVWSVLLVIPVVIAVTWNQREVPALPPRRAQSIVVNQFFPLLYPYFQLAGEEELSLGLTLESAVDELHEHHGAAALSVLAVQRLPHNLRVLPDPDNATKAEMHGLPLFSTDQTQRGFAIAMATDLAGISRYVPVGPPQ